MAIACSLSATSRWLRVGLGLGVALTGIFINGHPILGRLLGLAGAVIILSAFGGG